MPKVHPITPSMNTGELTPRLAARVDFNKYQSGVETMENLIPLPKAELCAALEHVILPLLKQALL